MKRMPTQTPAAARATGSAGPVKPSRAPLPVVRRTFSALVLAFVLAVGSGFGCRPEGPPEVSSSGDAVILRVATYNIEDVRTADLRRPDHPRLQRAAAVIQRLRPDILLVNEMTYDQPGGPGVRADEAPGQNGRRFAETYLAVSQGDGLAPLRYRAFMAPSNTGIASGFDLDRNGRVVTDIPVPGPPNADGTPAAQTAADRAYGGDAWGFGVFPGQYAMALFVRDDLEILVDSVRTFRLLPWQRMPGARMPVDPDTGAPWYAGEAGAQFRLSSKSHWDVPVRLPDGRILHVLASHPTPPAFDGPERRNVRRNHDEIRFWADYLDGDAYVEDDSGRVGGLPGGAAFVILGDQNADPDEGDGLDDPVGTWLLRHPRVNGAYVPRASPEGVAAYPRLDPDDTAAWGLRVDYVLPSRSLRVIDGGVARPTAADTLGVTVSDHFPVWLDLALPE